MEIKRRITRLSRYNQERHFDQISDTKWLVHGESFYMRAIGDEKLVAIDYEGGPYIAVGDKLGNTLHIITKIEGFESKELPNCYKLTTTGEGENRLNQDD